MACMCGDSQCPSCGLAQGTLETKCYLCGATDHDFCGFCSICREHAVFVTEPGEDTPLSECCGAGGYTYDYSPEPDDLDESGSQGYISDSWLDTDQ